MIEIRGLTRCFGNLTAVDDLHLEIPQGKFFAFLGPNAAGKTTTIRILAGLLRPTAGHCSVGGFDVQADPRAAKSILSFVPDFPFLYDKLTALEFMRFVAELYVLPRAVAERETGALFEKLHL